MDTLCFSSGGIYGLTYITALQYLINNNYIQLENINIFVGTSVGSILSLLLVVGYTPDELFSFIKNYDIKEIEPDINIDLIFESYGFDNFDKVTNLLKFLCERKLKLKEFNFYDLFILTKKKLIMNSTNFNTGTELIMDYEKTPNLCVFKAISMSCCIPLIYTPILYENEYYLDGALSRNILLDICNPKTTLGLYLDNLKKFNLSSIRELIIGSLIILSNKLYIDNDKYTILKISCDSEKFIPADIDQSFIFDLFKMGKESADIFYKNELKILIRKTKNNIKIVKNNIIQDVLNNIINNIEINNQCKTIINKEYNNKIFEEKILYNTTSSNLIINDDNNIIKNVLDEIINLIIIN
jgi:hypothetical protein